MSGFTLVQSGTLLTISSHYDGKETTINVIDECDGPLDLAACYYNENCVEKDYKKAFDLFNEAAQDDVNGIAFYDIGICYEYGNCVEKNSQKAVEYYQLSAEKEGIHGQSGLADCYYNGIGIEKDFVKAFKLYEGVAQEDESGRAFQLIIRFDARVGVSGT